MRLEHKDIRRGSYIQDGLKSFQRGEAWGIPSNLISTTHFSDNDITDLLTSVDSYLSSSTKRLMFITFFSTGEEGEHLCSIIVEAQA